MSGMTTVEWRVVARRDGRGTFAWTALEGEAEARAFLAKYAPTFAPGTALVVERREVGEWEEVAG